MIPLRDVLLMVDPIDLSLRSGKQQIIRNFKHQGMRMIPIHVETRRAIMHGEFLETLHRASVQDTSLLDMPYACALNAGMDSIQGYRGEDEDV